jgi:hypothetical protein
VCSSDLEVTLDDDLLLSKYRINGPSYKKVTVNIRCSEVRAIFRKLLTMQPICERILQILSSSNEYSMAENIQLMVQGYKSPLAAALLDQKIITYNIIDQ